jgi:hypothetical protein
MTLKLRLTAFLPPVSRDRAISPNNTIDSDVKWQFVPFISCSDAGNFFAPSIHVGLYFPRR